MSASVYKLESDKQFIRTLKGQPDVIRVFEYKGDPTAFEIAHASSFCFGAPLTTVGPASSGAPFTALEVWGVTIGGDKLKELARDLAFVGDGCQTFSLLVNRQGLCLLRVGSDQIMRLRISDRFGWSKYGVEPKVSTSWSVYDMSSGAVLLKAPPVCDLEVKEVDGAYRGRGDNEDDFSSSSSSGGWKKVAEEKEKEVASLKAALRALMGDK